MEERVMPNVTVGQSAFPRFVSYDNRLRMENIFENVDFEGQYTQAGSRVRSGEQDDFAKLKFRQGNNVVLTVSAKSFVFGRERISAPLAQVRIPVGDGEIWHQICEIRYDDTRRELSVLHPSTSMFRNPIYNTYHNLDMHVEAIYWNIDSPFMDFRMLRIPNNTSVGTFESNQFFSQQDMQDLMRHIEHNPLFVLRRLSEEQESRTLAVSQVARVFRLDIVQARIVLLRMASMGFYIMMQKKKWWNCEKNCSIICMRRQGVPTSM